jgi:hypothetical protein
MTSCIQYLFNMLICCLDSIEQNLALDLDNDTFSFTSNVIKALDKTIPDDGTVDKQAIAEEIVTKTHQLIYTDSLSLVKDEEFMGKWGVIAYLSM